jgi:hypothetical protein
MTQANFINGTFPNSISASLVRSGAYSNFDSSLSRDEQIAVLEDIASHVLKDLVIVEDNGQVVRFKAQNHSHFLEWKIEETA